MTMQRRSVLVIEDEASWLRLHKRVLNAAGFRVRTAGTCAAGIELAGSLKPDCIVLDFNLPDGDAVDVCRAITGNKEISGIPVIVFSSDQEAEKTAYTKCKAARFMLKGSDSLMELPAAICNLLYFKAGTTRPSGQAHEQPDLWKAPDARTA